MQIDACIGFRLYRQGQMVQKLEDRKYGLLSWELREILWIELLRLQVNFLNEFFSWYFHGIFNAIKAISTENLSFWLQS